MFSAIPVWREAPFVRLLIPFIAAMPFQWHFHVGRWSIVAGLITTAILQLLFSLKTVVARFKIYWATGLLLNSLIFLAGLLLMLSADHQNHDAAITKIYRAGDIIVATLEEPPIEKPKTFKAVASLKIIHQGASEIQVAKGRIIIYFQKDSFSTPLTYGSRIYFVKPLEQIRNIGNPGSFDYRRFCRLQEIYYQVYLENNEYTNLPARPKPLKKFVYETRSEIVEIIRRYIPGKKESGLAEALLIGYKDDLDKDLVRSYSSTGVVHIIAISGLHVGLIYGLLLLLLTGLSRKKTRWLKPILTITALWVFSLLAGASPSVLRSAVMFTFIIAGQSFSRKISVYNSLAASAFLLLCYNPFWFWDVGFQLSYAAVLSIMVFMKPIYDLCFIQNKILDAIWKLNAVTISAQILTLPLCIYYFNQVPNFFLVTNLVAVPLSSLILVGELLLCACSNIIFISGKLGTLLHWLIFLMNRFIERTARLPFAVTENIRLSDLQLILIYVFIVSLSIAVGKRNRIALKAAVAILIAFGFLRYLMHVEIHEQRKIIVYNAGNLQAIDFIEGHDHFFQGDSILIYQKDLKNFYLQPSRILHQVTNADSLPGLIHDGSLFIFRSISLLIIEKKFTQIQRDKIPVDVIVLSKNPAITVADLCKRFDCKQIIIDATNSKFRTIKWKQECKKLSITKC